MFHVSTPNYFQELLRIANLSWPSQQQLSLRKTNAHQPDAKWACIQMKRECKNSWLHEDSLTVCTPPQGTHSVRGPTVTRLYFVRFVSLLRLRLEKKTYTDTDSVTYWKLTRKITFKTGVDNSMSWTLWLCISWLHWSINVTHQKAEKSIDWTRSLRAFTVLF